MDGMAPGKAGGVPPASPHRAVLEADQRVSFASRTRGLKRDWNKFVRAIADVAPPNRGSGGVGRRL